MAPDSKEPREWRERIEEVEHHAETLIHRADTVASRVWALERAVFPWAFCEHEWQSEAGGVDVPPGYQGAVTLELIYRDVCSKCRVRKQDLPTKLAALRGSPAVAPQNDGLCECVPDTTCHRCGGAIVAGVLDLAKFNRRAVAPQQEPENDAGRERVDGGARDTRCKSTHVSHGVWYRCSMDAGHEGGHHGMVGDSWCGWETIVLDGGTAFSPEQPSVSPAVSAPHQQTTRWAVEYLPLNESEWRRFTTTFDTSAEAYEVCKRAPNRRVVALYASPASQAPAPSVPEERPVSDTQLPFRTSTPPRLAEGGLHRMTNVDAWYDAKNKRLLVIGAPVESAADDDPRGHNCDEMGCASVGGHNLVWAKVTRPASLAASVPPEKQQAGDVEERERMARRLEKAWGFLTGETDLDGGWFGDHPVGGVGRYWWRSRLRPLIEEIAAALRGSRTPSSTTEGE